MPAFSLPSAPQEFTRLLRRPGNAPLPIRLDFIATNPAASVVNFSPVTFSAQDPSASELLRTLQRMAASKPTS